ncbi:MAG TPA: aminotransferase class III-fold pyridoxal phosphate-dependent enzyme [Thermomicrobiales bacterium]|nr:aminotransferase class III-fold pyridoxal phosphate-dependent enzyme [Thermomicrobiales bacterium]
MDPETTNVIHRDLTKVYQTVVRGEGIYLFDAEGRRYIDGSGGSAAVTSIGHGVPEVAEAIARQARTLAYAPTHAFTTEPIEACARTIVEAFAPPGFTKVWFVSGGSEATENAVKMALQHHRDRGRASKQFVIGRWMSFHGATLAALGYGGNAGRRRPYGLALPSAQHIPPCFPYRCWTNPACPACDLSCADQLDRTIRQLGPENVAAFIAEPVIGATLAAVAAPDGYLARIREICDRHDVIFIADEVMTGFGRTGRNFAVDHWGVAPDLIACAKGISGGYAPLGAVLAKPEFVDEARQRRGSFVIGHTASGNPLSCAAGAAVLRYIADHRLVENAAEVGAYFLERLRELQTRHAMIGDVRGLGLLLGVEFVRDRATKQPFPRAWNVARRVGAATLERGLVSYPGSGTADGIEGDHLLYAPPLIITCDQIDELIAILDDSLAAVADETAELEPALV